MKRGREDAETRRSGTWQRLVLVVGSGALLLCGALGTKIARGEGIEGRIDIEVREPVGIRRFAYPVSVRVDLAKPVGRETRFRLLLDGRPVLAQFRPGSAEPRVSWWWLDFPVNLLPYQTLLYTVEYGRDVAEGPRSKRGLQLSQDGDSFRVVNAPSIAWTVPRCLGGLLRSVRSGELEYLRADSSGLTLMDKGGKEHVLCKPGSSDIVSHVVRKGPLAVALRFEVVEKKPELQGVKSVVDLGFPLFKSWVEVDWQIEDPMGKLGGMSATLHLNLQEPTRQASTLVDFGASSLVYLSLSSGQVAQLRASTAGMPSVTKPANEPSHLWQVYRGRPDKLEPFVLGQQHGDSSSSMEGWAHVMDRQRCLALAVDRFGQVGADLIDVTALGTVGIDHTFGPAAQPHTPPGKRLHFWLHFVPFPPQQTAATSPQSMQAPVLVELRNPIMP